MGRSAIMFGGWYSRRQRYPSPYGYDYGYRGRPYRGNSCLRDACLLESGCCLGEALSDNCLLLGLMLLPGTVVALARAPRRAAREDGPLVGAIRTYQRRISNRRPPCCRFTPSCSNYAAGAITSHGAYRGLLLAARRLLRCRPRGARGYDPVPARRTGCRAVLRRSAQPATGRLVSPSAGPSSAGSHPAARRTRTCCGSGPGRAPGSSGAAWSRP